MRRRGLSAFELALVFLLIMGVMALILPLVQKHRETAARTQTNDNLKRCALAVHEFHDTYRRLPDAYDAHRGNPDELRSLWFHLLPFLGHADAHKQGDLRAAVEFFLAPSDPSAVGDAGRLSFAGNLRIFAFQTFTAAKANNLKLSLTLPPAGKPMSSSLTSARIVDGTSNTWMLATRYSWCSEKTTEYAAHPSDHGGFFGAGVYTKPPGRARDDAALMYQIAPDLDPDSPNACNPTPGLFGHAFGHGGMSMALADGTVKNVSPHFLPERFMRAVCPGDQVPLGNDHWVDN